MKIIVEAYAPECLKDRRRTTALFADLAPKNTEEKGILLTAYNCGAVDLLINAHCWWWLRSSGNVQNEAANITNEGLIRSGGDRVSGNNLGIRPAIWIFVE